MDLQPNHYASFIALLSCIAIGAVVFRSRHNRDANAFVWTAASLAAWIGTNFLVDIAEVFNASNSTLLTLTRLTLVGPALFPVLFLFFAHYFRDAEAPLSKRVAAIFPAIFLAITLTPLNVRSVEVVDGTVGVELGYGYYLYIVYFLIFSGWGLWRILKNRSGQDLTRNRQVRIVIAGISLTSFTGLFFSVVMPLIGRTELVSFAPLSSIFFVGCTAYAIAVYHVFDIRIIIRRTIVYSTLLLATLLTYSMVIMVFATLFNQENIWSTRSVLANLVAAGLICIGYDPLQHWLQDATDRFLFRKDYEQQEVIKELSDTLNTVTALDEAVGIVMETLVKTLKVRHALTYVFSPAENGQHAIKRIKQVGYNAQKNLLLLEKDFVIPYFSVHPAITTTSDLSSLQDQEERFITRSSTLKKDPPANLTDLIREHAKRAAVIKRLRSLDAEIVIPLHLGEQPIGLILLSKKMSDDAFNTSDLQLLDLVGAQAISSIQKAKLYEGDQMKSEFVSIASHELLTPISAIEGYLSMILDENLGKIDPQARSYLEKVYTSSRRLSALIKDLLSVSRIESGKMTFNLQAVDPSKMVTDTIDQLRFMAKEKGLQLNYEAPSHKLPMVNADPDRVMQVLVNLVSNAIKYTPSGTVTIKAGLVRQHVEIEVHDSGIGISKEQQSHLFEKFYRVDSPETAGIGGTGLGLYITRSIIERMGGSIEVKSVTGKGTTFSFTMPKFQVENSTVQE